MRIAQVAPLHESVPPRLYGGTERIVSYLTEECVRNGHDVTLFASGDSATAARLRPGCDRALRLRGGKSRDALALHLRMLEMVARETHGFDVVHFHLDYLHFPVARRQQCPTLTTLHNRLDIAEIHPLYREFTELPLVSISRAQRRPMPWANWVGTVYHGIPEDLYRLREGPGKYLAFMGRISPEKRLDRAIEIAKRAAIPLKVAAKIDPADREYFESRIRKQLGHPLIEFVGEIAEAEKSQLLGEAHALLFPIDWPEPFGLVMIEALACGTPVIAFGAGSVPEVLDDGQTGYVVHNLDEAVKAVGKIPDIDRHICRQIFEQRFSARRMCADYTALYRHIQHGRFPGSQARAFPQSGQRAASAFR